MIDRTRSVSESIRTSLWVWPVLMTLVAIALAQGMILLDQSGWLASRPWLTRAADRFGIVWMFGAGPDGARTLLATIAASMVTIAVTVYSITIVVLSLTAGQMGPRLLRTFMRDRSTQVSLGVFVATFAFCVIILGVIDAHSPSLFVPRASVSLALVLALVSLAVLIYFIHHVASSIQAPEVICVVGRELGQAIEHVFPGGIGGDAEYGPDEAVRMRERFTHASASVPAQTSGYLRSIDGKALVELAASADVALWLARRPGDHVLAGTEIARIWPAGKATETLADKVRSTFLFGGVRTPEQDVLFLVNQLVEIAQRALSPGINDPITAEACIDQLAVALGAVMRQRLPSALRADSTGEVRVAARPHTFASILAAAFDPIRNYSGTCVQVSLRLAAVLGELALLARTQEQRAALLDQLRMVHRAARSLTEERDRARVEEQCRKATEALERAGTGDRHERAGTPAASGVSSS